MLFYGLPCQCNHCKCICSTGKPGKILTITCLHYKHRPNGIPFRLRFNALTMMLLLLLLLLQKLRFLCVFSLNLFVCSFLSTYVLLPLTVPVYSWCYLFSYVILAAWFRFYVIDRHRTETIFYFILNEIPFYCHRICVFETVWIRFFSYVFFFSNSTLL